MKVYISGVEADKQNAKTAHIDNNGKGRWGRIGRHVEGRVWSVWWR